MRASTKQLLIGMTLAAVAGCTRAATPEPVDTAADVAAINAVRDREVALIVSGSPDGLGDVYAPDIVMMPPNEPAVNGVAAMQTWWATMASQVTMAARYTSSEVNVSGDWAVDRYTAELTMTPKAAGGAPMTETIKGVHVLQRGADGTWHIVQDVWNSDAPPPAAPAPGGD